MTEHLSPDRLDLIAGGEMPPDDLEQADQHLRGCGECRELLQTLLPSGAGLLAAVRYEAQRHLTFEELEACLTPDGERALDPLAASHLDSCGTCRRELDDLRSFEALPSRTRANALAAAQPVPMNAPVAVAASWFSIRAAWAGWAGALATGLVLALVVSRLVPFGGDAEYPVVVHLRPDNGAQATGGPRALRPDASDTLAREVLVQIARAQTAATQNGSPQVLTLHIARSQYPALLDVLAAIGTFEGDPLTRRPAGGGSDTIEVAITLIP
jgi:hypothetical protein